MPQKLFLHIITTATTPALIAAITPLTDSATHVQATIHKQRAEPFQTVTLMTAVTLVTITALRCQNCANVSWATMLHLPDRRVQSSAAFTPIAPATISRHIVQCTRQATASVTPIVLLT